jgi:hypothetical protein
VNAGRSKIFTGSALKRESQNPVAVFAEELQELKVWQLLTSRGLHIQHKQRQGENEAMFNELLAIACTVIAGIFAAGAIEANIWK